jgi:serine/threonine protein kinase
MGSTLDRGSLLHKRYRIVEILGQGGMGSVYRAVDESLGVDVAVKENLFTTDEYARQFRLEAVILANLRHPNLPRVTDHFVIADQGQYLTMDFIEGEDLRQRMERVGTVSEEEAILIGAAMCDALQYLHTRKPAVIHRDVKPGNVRIMPDGHIYLVDFGLAKLVKGSQATTTGARAMTPGYSPPEQYGTARTGPRTDVYSLGATLYAALTGVIPEDGLARAMDNVELTPLRKRNPKVSRKLASAIEKAMAVRPEDRFQSADEFRQALLTSNVKTQRLEGEILVQPPPEASGFDEDANLAREVPPDPISSPVSRPPSKPLKKGWSTGCWISFSFFLLTILAVLLSVIIFWSPITKAIISFLATTTPVSSSPTALVMVNTPPPSSTPTVKLAFSPTPTRTPLPTLTPSITPSPTRTVTATPTQLGGGHSQIAFASNRTGLPQIFIMNSDASGLRQVTDLAEGACQPDWSPDGMRMVFISPCLSRTDEHPGAKMFIINADGSGLTELPFSGSGDYDPAWSPDGTRIAFAFLQQGQSQISVLNLNDNSVTRLTEISADVRFPDWSRQPAWSPDGTQIVYTGHGRLTDSLQIWIMSATGSDPALLIHRGPTNWDSLPVWSPDGKTVLLSETTGPMALGWLMTFDYEKRQTADAVHLRKGTYATHGDYSPDGMWVVYESLDITNASSAAYDIYIINDGNAPIRLTNDTKMDFDPDWRPISAP